MYRPDSEVTYWTANDPIEKFIAQHSVSMDTINKIKASVADEIASAFEFAESSPFPPSAAAYVGEFAE